MEPESGEPAHAPAAESTNLIEFPTAHRPTAEVALEELEHVYAFVHARVGNRPDAEDVTQQVALKALPRLREGAPTASVRAYLFATSRTVLATFWATRFGIPEDELGEEVAGSSVSFELNLGAVERVTQILDELPGNYRRVLELRFLRGYSLRETAAELGTTVGNVKVMQLRALRAAGRSQPGD